MVSRRLQSFDVSCKQPNGEWTTVLDQTSTAARDQFEAVAEPPQRQYPCTTCWVQLTFDSACTGVAWRIDNMNGPAFHGRIYLFEVVFAHVSLPELPPSLPPKIQGWCIKHQVVDGINSNKFGPTCSGMCHWSSSSYKLATFQADFTSVPCASQLAVEIYIPQSQRWGYACCDQNNQLRLKTGSGKDVFLTPVSDGQVDGCATAQTCRGGRASVGFTGKGRYAPPAQTDLDIAKTSQTFKLYTQTQALFASLTSPASYIDVSQ